MQTTFIIQLAEPTSYESFLGHHELMMRFWVNWVCVTLVGAGTSRDIIIDHHIIRLIPLFTRW